MRWTLPERITSENIDYAKHCLSFAKRTLVCGHTMKTKSLNNEQYCNYFMPKSDIGIKMDEQYESERIKKLEQMINEFEQAQSDKE